jgi:TolB-like protein/DNA-binding winged helix-turn-helix (wHTH) protein/tetratricopeptide (TPR) repeat protein
VSGRKISFDGWVLDRESGDLVGRGTRQRLQELPLKVLDLLIANPGQVVTREQLIAHVWPKGVVEFDTGLNTAIRKLRVALGDVGDSPRYIETLPRRGYRFLATLDAENDPTNGSVAMQPVDAVPASPPTSEPTPDGVQASDRAQAPAGVRTSDPVRAADGVRVSDRVPGAPASDGVVTSDGVPAAPVPRGRGTRYLLVAIATGVAVVAIAILAPFSTRHGTSATLTAQADRAGLALNSRTVAVLPFANHSPSGNDGYLALGIAENVLHRLASIKELTVISRTSSFVFKDDQDVREIGRKLNARYIVEGSVQHAGERLRVTAELIDATTGARQWSLSFDRQVTEIFSLEDEISAKVTDALSVSIRGDHGSDSAGQTSRVEAHLAYMKGRALMDTFKVADAEAAIQHFAQAAQIDPGFAAAYAQESRAITHVLSLHEREEVDESGIARAAALNDQALTLDPSLGEAWVQRATLGAIQKQDARITEQEYRRGLELAPNYGQGYLEFAEFLFAQNKARESLQTIDRARQLDPLTPRVHYMKAIFLINTNGSDPRQIETLMLQALAANPNYFPALTRLGQLYMSEDQVAQGIRLMEQALAIEPKATWIREALATAYLHINEAAAAQDVLDAEGGDIRGVQACVLLERGDEQAAAQFAYAFLSVPHPSTFPSSEVCAAASIRNEALSTKRYDRAIRVLAQQYAQHVGTLDEEEAVRFSVIWGLPYAEVLLAKGERARGTQLANAILAEVERLVDHAAMRSLPWFWRARALAVLGEPGPAVEALQAAVAHGFTARPWILDHEPSFALLRDDPRYRQTVARQRQWVATQQARLFALRKAGQVPGRHSADTPSP